MPVQTQNRKSVQVQMNDDIQAGAMVFAHSSEILRVCITWITYEDIGVH